MDLQIINDCAGTDPGWRYFMTFHKFSVNKYILKTILEFDQMLFESNLVNHS